MDTTKTNSILSITGEVSTEVHDTTKLEESVEDYDSLTKREKLELVREREPEYSETVRNVTVDRFHEYFVDNLDANQTSSEDNVTVEYMAFGTDSGSGTSTSDTDLNNRVYSEQVSSVADNGKSLLASALLDSNEANGNTLNEVGLYTGGPANLGNSDVFMLNHATFSDIVKDSSKTVAFDVTLSFSDT